MPKMSPPFLALLAAGVILIPVAGYVRATRKPPAPPVPEQPKLIPAYVWDSMKPELRKQKEEEGFRRYEYSAPKNLPRPGVGGAGAGSPKPRPKSPPKRRSGGGSAAKALE